MMPGESCKIMKKLEFDSKLLDSQRTSFSSYSLHPNVYVRDECGCARACVHRHACVSARVDACVRTHAGTWQRASCHSPFTPLMNRRRSGRDGRGGVCSITKIKESRRENR